MQKVYQFHVPYMYIQGCYGRNSCDIDKTLLYLRLSLIKLAYLSDEYSSSSIARLYSAVYWEDTGSSDPLSRAKKTTSTKQLMANTVPEFSELEGFCSPIPSNCVLWFQSLILYQSLSGISDTVLITDHVRKGLGILKAGYYLFFVLSQKWCVNTTKNIFG